MKPRIKKAIIPIAGYGTSFLPASKAMPKEMIPIVDKPIIQFALEEALASGIEEIILVTGRNKMSVEAQFDANLELEYHLENQGKFDQLAKLRSMNYSNIFYVRQSYPKGLGDAILQARPMVEDEEAFVVILADNILEEAAEKSCLDQMLQAYEEVQAPIIAYESVSQDEISQYGSVILEEAAALAKVKQLIEKPKAFKSNLATIGRYVLTAEIFPYLEDLPAGRDGETHLTDALDLLAQDRAVYAVEIESQRWNVGSKIGYMKKMIDYGLKHPETQDEFKAYLKDYLSQGRIEQDG